MKYDKVRIGSFGYELPNIVVTSQAIEESIRPTLDRLKIPSGQLEALTGIKERRWWPKGYSIVEGATAAAKSALQKCAVDVKEIDALVYAGVCREVFEPATATYVAANIGLPETAAVYDLSNACLGVMNGMVEIANKIELGQIECGMVVACESSRDVNEQIIQELQTNQTSEFFSQSFATLTGGSGAVAVILHNGKFADGHRLLGGTLRNDTSQNNLCRWGIEKLENSRLHQFMKTDAPAVLKYGLELGLKTWKSFLNDISWMEHGVTKVITHQVGKAHADSLYGKLGLDAKMDYSTFPYLGNIGSVSVPITAAIAEENGFLKKGDRVGFLGIGSGLSCMMLGVEW